MLLFRNNAATKKYEIDVFIAMKEQFYGLISLDGLQLDCYFIFYNSKRSTVCEFRF